MIRLNQLSSRGSGLTTINFPEEMLERKLTCGFLPLAVEFFVTSHSTLITSVTMALLSVGIIILCNASGSIVLKRFNQFLCGKVFQQASYQAIRNSALA
jgi:hypothetical protein